MNRSALATLAATLWLVAACATDDLAPPGPEAAPEPTPAPTFSAPRGFYDTPFELVVTPPHPEAAVAVAIGGETPILPKDAAPTGPVAVAVTTTTVVRAVARLPGLGTSDVTTHTYVFPRDVMRQEAHPPGLPPLRVHPDKSSPVDLDAEMDPAIIGGAYAGFFPQALLGWPSISVSLDPDRLFGPAGVYTAGGLDEPNAEHEERASVELLHPGRPDEDQQLDAGLRPHTWVALKRSFRLMFRSEYGAGKLEADLMEDAPLSGDGAAEDFDRLVLRAGKNRSWATPFNPDDTTFTRDQWARDTQLAVSGYGARGTWAHLYLNGLYWGLYNVAERPDEHWLKRNFGGDEDDWFAVNHNGVVHGDPGRWRHLTETLVSRDATDPKVYADFAAHLDLARFADYLLINWYAGTWDWPGNNYFAAHRANPPGPLFFVVWDAEESWDAECSSGPYDQPGGGGSDGAWVPPAFRPGQFNRWIIPTLWHALARSSDFLMLFADRAHRHLTGAGALTDAASQTRWRALAEAIQTSVVAESARWGDARRSFGEPTRTMDGSWLPEVRRIHDERMPGNAARLIAALRAYGYYPPHDPPAASLGSGGHLVLTTQGQPGEVWYTLDGTDPRAPGGAPAPSATRFEGARALPAGLVTVKARTRLGEVWSALTEEILHSNAPEAR